MRLLKLNLENFRNYPVFSLSFDTNITLFSGDNAQGKTNILEAIYLLSTGKSHRTLHERDMVRWQHAAFRVQAEVNRRDGNFFVSYWFSPEHGKEIRINGQKSILRELLGIVNTVLFSPEDLQLIKGGPHERRRFLNMEIAQISKTYYLSLQKYEHILRQRNNLLRAIKSRQARPDLLDAWDQHMVEVGSVIIAKRLEAVKKLGILARLMHRKLTSGQESLGIKYYASVGIRENSSLQEIRDCFAAKLAEFRRENIERGTTLHGPHRDDLLFTLNDADLKLYGSQGQQRTGVLALKMAELEFMKSETGEYPLLLLDDVMSELDALRQGHLLDTISDHVQTFITSTGARNLDPNGRNIRVYTVDNGRITG